MNKLNKMIENKTFIICIKECLDLYIKHGARSSKKTDHLHNFLKNEIKKILPSDNYNIKIEDVIKSINFSNKKKCDIIIYKDNNPIIILPIKMIMSNYFQNRNNYWESLTGEIIHLKWANPNIKIIPINILFNKIPYLLSNSKIKKFENIEYNNSFCIYNKLIEHNIIDNNINYIINVKHICNINEKYDKAPIIINYNKQTPFISLKKILLKSNLF